MPEIALNNVKKFGSFMEISYLCSAIPDCM